MIAGNPDRYRINVIDKDHSITQALARLRLLCLSLFCSHPGFIGLGMFLGYQEVAPGVVEFEVAVPRLTPALR
jgi:hypothetical protein